MAFYYGFLAKLKTCIFYDNKQTESENILNFGVIWAGQRMMLSLVSCHCGSFFTLSTCCPRAVEEMLENFPENILYICTAPWSRASWTRVAGSTGTGCRRLWSKLKQNFALKQKTETKKEVEMFYPRFCSRQAGGSSSSSSSPQNLSAFLWHFRQLK